MGALTSSAYDRSSSHVSWQVFEQAVLPVCPLISLKDILTEPHPPCKSAGLVLPGPQGFLPRGLSRQALVLSAPQRSTE
eukprot:1134635-Pelagomonas_calceolata.AAC.3